MRIYTRAEWGARYAAGFGQRRVGSLDKWLHHSVTRSPGPGASFEQDAATIRELEDIGQSRFGQGISYTLCITEAGRAFEGTGIDRVGSHTANRNTGAAGIVLVGNYQDRPPTPQQIATLVGLLRHGKAAGWWQVAALTGAHRQVSSTACPGDHAFALIGAINAAARDGAPLPDGGTVPVSNPSPLPPKADERPRNADGSLRLVTDGSRGPATIGRWQEVMGTPIDWKISPYPPGSSLIRADQEFLNRVVSAEHIRNLTGAPRLSVDGDEGRKTVITRQFWLRNTISPVHQRNLTGDVLAFDGDWGPKSTRVLQFALNHARTGSREYGRVA